MRYITKGSADRLLSKRHRAPPTTAAAATKAWKSFKSKSATRNKCLEEQYGLCAYSEVSLDDSHPVIDAQGLQLSRPLGIHLEHVEPKSRNPARTFDHTNLVACAIDDVKARGLICDDVFGGHAKLSWYCPNGFIHPLLAACRDYFHYESNGRIVPKAGLARRERAKARLTIFRLNLNAPVLVVWRRTWLQQAETIIDELLDDPVALRHFAEAELLPTNDRLRPFHSAQRQLFGNIGEQVCVQYSPRL